MKATTWVLTSILLGSALTAGAQAPDSKAEDEKAIRSAVDTFVAAFAKGDAKALAALFTERGEAIDVGGEAIRGRDELEAHYAQRFESSPGEKVEAEIELIHFLAPEVARQDGRSKLVPADGGPPTTSRYTSTFVKRDGRWLVASIRELDDPSIPHHERLKELEWLVGEWVEETGDAVIDTTYAWSEDRNFLLRDYVIKGAGKADLKGTQRIGWDPLNRQIKSWVFDSRGGHGEGHWTRSGEHWIIKSTGVRPDGLTTSATQTLVRLGKDRLLWSSTARTLGAETRDDLHEIMMVRKPPQPTK